MRTPPARAAECGLKRIATSLVLAACRTGMPLSGRASLSSRPGEVQGWRRLRRAPRKLHGAYLSRVPRHVPERRPAAHVPDTFVPLRSILPQNDPDIPEAVPVPAMSVTPPLQVTSAWPVT